MQIVHVEDISARRAAYVEVPHELSENMRSALRSTGITQLYTHQVWIFSRLHATVLLRKTSWLMCFNFFFIFFLMIFTGRVNTSLTFWEECCCGNNDIEWKISLLQSAGLRSSVPQFIRLCSIFISNKGCT